MFVVLSLNRGQSNPCFKSGVTSLGISLFAYQNYYNFLE